MANKRISDLERADVMAATDMFIMQQTASGEAMRMDGSVIQTFAENKAAQKAEQFINQHREEFYQGPRGYGVVEVEKVSGTGAAGTYDTYRGVIKDPDTEEIVGYTSTWQVWNGENGEGAILKFENVTVPVSAWVADDTYEDFPYRASIALAGITTAMVPHVVLDVPEAISGNFAPVTEAYSGGVYIYASEVPDAAITIPSIVGM